MILSQRRLMQLGFGLFVAALFLWPSREDPDIVRGVRCTADAYVVAEYLRDRDGADAGVWRERWARLDARVKSWRRQGRHEPARLGGMIAKRRDVRAARIAEGQGDAWLAAAMTRVESCADLTAARAASAAPRA